MWGACGGSPVALLANRTIKAENEREVAEFVRQSRAALPGSARPLQPYGYNSITVVSVAVPP